MQKALTQMNVQLANVISDLSGLTGQLIVRAIVGGERDPQKLAKLRDRRIQASPEEVAKSLEGNWRPELLFLVKQEVDTYDTYQKRIAECDEQLQQQLASFASVAPAAAAPVTNLAGDEQPKKTKAKRKKLAKNAPRFNLEQELQRVAGVDLTRIDGIDVMVAQTRWEFESSVRFDRESCQYGWFFQIIGTKYSARNHDSRNITAMTPTPQKKSCTGRVRIRGGVGSGSNLRLGISKSRPLAKQMLPGRPSVPSPSSRRSPHDVPGTKNACARSRYSERMLSARATSLAIGSMALFSCSQTHHAYPAVLPLRDGVHTQYPGRTLHQFHSKIDTRKYFRFILVEALSKCHLLQNHILTQTNVPITQKMKKSGCRQ